jgi:hypothetical protein
MSAILDTILSGEDRPEVRNENLQVLAINVANNYYIINLTRKL